MYHRVTKEERRLLSCMRQAGDGIGEIARRLGRAGSTIGRELRRNRGETGLLLSPSGRPGSGPDQAGGLAALHATDAGGA